MKLAQTQELKLVTCEDAALLRVRISRYRKRNGKDAVLQLLPGFPFSTVVGLQGQSMRDVMPNSGIMPWIIVCPVDVEATVVIRGSHSGSDQKVVVPARSIAFFDPFEIELGVALSPGTVLVAMHHANIQRHGPISREVKKQHADWKKRFKRAFVASFQVSSGIEDQSTLLPWLPSEGCKDASAAESPSGSEGREGCKDESAAESSSGSGGREGCQYESASESSSGSSGSSFSDSASADDGGESERDAENMRALPTTSNFAGFAYEENHELPDEVGFAYENESTVAPIDGEDGRRMVDVAADLVVDEAAPRPRCSIPCEHGMASNCPMGPICGHPCGRAIDHAGWHDCLHHDDWRGSASAQDSLVALDTPERPGFSRVVAGPLIEELAMCPRTPLSLRVRTPASPLQRTNDDLSPLKLISVPCLPIINRASAVGLAGSASASASGSSGLSAPQDHWGFKASGSLTPRASDAAVSLPRTLGTPDATPIVHRIIFASDAFSAQELRSLRACQHCCRQLVWAMQPESLPRVDVGNVAFVSINLLADRGGIERRLGEGKSGRRELEASLACLAVRKCGGWFARSDVEIRPDRKLPAHENRVKIACIRSGLLDSGSGFALGSSDGCRALPGSVEESTSRPWLGFFGAPAGNVALLNLGLRLWKGENGKKSIESLFLESCGAGVPLHLLPVDAVAPFPSVFNSIEILGAGGISSLNKLSTGNENFAVTFWLDWSPSVRLYVQEWMRELEDVSAHCTALGHMRIIDVLTTTLRVISSRLVDIAGDEHVSHAMTIAYTALRQEDVVSCCRQREDVDSMAAALVTHGLSMASDSLCGISFSLLRDLCDLRDAKLARWEMFLAHITMHYCRMIL